MYLERTPDISSTMIRKDKFKIVRLGIVGTGRIAPRFVAESKYVSGIDIVCAYNPEIENGKRFQQLINVAQSGQIGEIKDVEACFTRFANEDSRERTDGEFGGAYLEFGSYTLLPIFKLLGTNYKDVTFHSIKDENGVDLYTKIQILYEDAMATAKMGVAVKSEGQLVVAGTQGYILAESPWWLTKRFVVRYENPSIIDSYEPSFQGDGLRYEISEFILQINGRSKRGYKLTEKEAIAMAEITEKFMEFKKK